MRSELVKLLATFFRIGNFPVAPGSLASLAGALLAVALHGHAFGYVVVFIVITATGFAVSGRMERLVGQKDPSCVVIDEVSGVLLAFFLLPLTPAVFLTAFFLFRAFDMFKVYPADRFEEFPGSSGIMADDLVAGLYTNLTMQIALRWAGII
ncbi:MAG: phosphatidylglycerophosphatase A [Candidatus Omnitrophica bacterium]|nr:phosphatidylglycerophosphatase A [Candidatus Omnitrophota bacterium]